MLASIPGAVGPSAHAARLLRCCIAALHHPGVRDCTCVLRNLADVRLALGLTQVEMGHQLGVSASTVRRYEADPGTPNHFCPPRPVAILLQLYCQTDTWQERLDAARVVPVLAIPA